MNAPTAPVLARAQQAKQQSQQLRLRLRELRAATSAAWDVAVALRIGLDEPPVPVRVPDDLA